MNNLAEILEAILFVGGDPVDTKDICGRLSVSADEMNEAVDELKKKYSGKCGIILLQFNSKIQFSTNKEYVDSVSLVLNPVREKELTKAMLETLAIIAYKQPITRAEIEEIRGVDCAYAVTNLSKLAMIEAVGKKDAIGKPVLFGTTDTFLRHFSLCALNELPAYEELLSRLNTVDDTQNQSLFSFVDIEKEAG